MFTVFVHQRLFPALCVVAVRVLYPAAECAVPFPPHTEGSTVGDNDINSQSGPGSLITPTLLRSFHTILTFVNSSCGINAIFDHFLYLLKMCLRVNVNLYNPGLVFAHKSPEHLGKWESNLLLSWPIQRPTYLILFLSLQIGSMLLYYAAFMFALYCLDLTAPSSSLSDLEFICMRLGFISTKQRMTTLFGLYNWSG